MGEPTAAVMLGAELRRLRLERGMSLRKLVRILGLTAHSNLVQYEMGRRIPPGDIITAYERIFGDSAAALARMRDRVLAERAADPGRATVPVPDQDRAGSDPRHRTSPAMLPAAIDRRLHRPLRTAAPAHGADRHSPVHRCDDHRDHRYGRGRQDRPGRPLRTPDP